MNGNLVWNVFSLICRVINSPYILGYTNRWVINNRNILGFTNRWVINNINILGYTNRWVTNNRNILGFTNHWVIDNAYILGFTNCWYIRSYHHGTQTGSRNAWSPCRDNLGAARQNFSAAETWLSQMAGPNIHTRKVSDNQVPPFWPYFCCFVIYIVPDKDMLPKYWIIIVFHF